MTSEFIHGFPFLVPDYDIIILLQNFTLHSVTVCHYYIQISEHQVFHHWNTQYYETFIFIFNVLSFPSHVLSYESNRFRFQSFNQGFGMHSSVFCSFFVSERATQAFSGFKRMTDFVQMFMILKLSFVQLLFCPSLYVLVPVCSCKCCCFLTYLTICCIILAKLLAISV